MVMYVCLLEEEIEIVENSTNKTTSVGSVMTAMYYVKPQVSVSEEIQVVRDSVLMAVAHHALTHIFCMKGSVSDTLLEY